MSTEACILAIGPYSEKVKDCLDYNRSAYIDVKDGAPVISRLFSVTSISETVMLADAVGISDYKDFGQHQIFADDVSIVDLDFIDRVDRINFETLSKNGFSFMLMVDM